MLLQKGVVCNNLDIYVFITVGMDILLQHALYCLFKICFHSSFFVIFTERTASPASLDDNASPFEQARATQDNHM
jgi:hypothetical protein